ncbi:hypothetical protein SS50377_22878 [Spironucleus salmonicida]|uniref:Uncharacterized protein n=1 Tax=Spironucleus salmonicida TaxID=348837 RepID=V6LVZ1_9EUKA|nr:hypothetical protein SS50377_22878 [Spironucleus salmonicida]|eukprot:EST48730.1 Hypothetical protein SS50377_11047 [Spironucleus salmonicida]
MNSQQKLRFSLCMVQYFGPDGRAAIRAVQAMSMAQKRDLFHLASTAADCSSRQAVDYFHNTWSRQFFQSPEPFRNEVRELWQAFSADPEQRYGEVYEIMQERHGGIFHRQALRQLVLKEYGRPPKFTQTDLDALCCLLGSTVYPTEFV